jgi:diguanylate cyclase (GGDEF)-like protein
MEASVYIALLNPSIALVLASTFLVLWLYQRHRRHIASLAAGYACGAAAFLLQYFVLPVGPHPTKLVSVTLFLASGLLICGAVIRRYGRPVPETAFAALAIGAIGTVSWFLFVEPDLTWRIYAINFALGAMSLLVAAEMRAVPHKGLIDWVILAAALLSGLNFIVRTLLVVHVYGAVEPYSAFHGSIYWTTVILSHAVLSIVNALALVTGTTLEVIAELQRKSETDPLSGLLNRRGFEEQASAMLAVNDCKGLASLVLCDLDHFKAVNDSLGHAAGDRVIAAFAELLRRTAPQGSVVGRIGGEEFAIVLANANVTVARLFAEGTRSAFAGMEVDRLPPERRFTASFGIAERGAGEGMSALLSRADAALYEAKNVGRDRVRAAPAATAALRFVQLAEGAATRPRRAPAG